VTPRALHSRGLATPIRFLLPTLLATVALAACGSGHSVVPVPTPSGSPHPGGTYNFPLLGDPAGIEPLTASEAQGMQVAHQVFQGLVAYRLQDDGALLARPSIAESWSVNADATVFTFKLRHGVLFQPPVGREVTAVDVVASWSRVTDPRNHCPTASVFAPFLGCDDLGYQIDPQAGLSGVRALDRYTLQVTLRYPFGELPQALGTTVAAIVPVEYIAKVGAEAFARKPVGTGPYMVADWQPGIAIDLVRDDLYWDPASAGHVSRINLPVVRDAAAAWELFKRGELDFTEVPTAEILEAENDPRVTAGEWLAVKWPSLSMSFVGVDMQDPTLGTAAAQAGLQLRQALSRSIDRAAVISLGDADIPLPATGIVPPGVPGFRAGQNGYTFDPERAKQAVAKLGLIPTLSYWYPAGLTEQRIAEALQAGWKAAGVDVTLSSHDPVKLPGQLADGVAGGSQLFEFSWTAAYPSMDQFLYPLFHSTSAASGSYTFYSNPAVDELLVKARSTPDATQRRNLYAQAEKTILGDAPCIPLTFSREFRVISKRVQAQMLDPMGFVDMWDVWVR
jgi:oligopeptide transport system substrate-binding protein